jgi:hypothetical protein
VDKAFKGQVGRNLEAYVDDVVIKIRTDEDMLQDIQETFDKLREIYMKLNPKKCSVRKESGKFLGVMVSKDGIKAHPDKVEAVLKMKSPGSVKEI